MSDIPENNTQLSNCVQIKNPNISQKLLTDTNFKVISVQPFKDPRGRANAIAKVLIDKFGDTALKIKDRGRYLTRRIKFTRVPLSTALEQAGFTVNELGSFQVPATDTVENFVASIRDKLHIEPSEIIFKSSGDKALVRALPYSLGYSGHVTIVKGGGAQPDNEVKKIVVIGPSEVDDFSNPTNYEFVCYNASDVVVPTPTSGISLRVGPVDTYRNVDESRLASGEFSVEWIEPAEEFTGELKVLYKTVTGTKSTVIEPTPVFEMEWVHAGMTYPDSFLSRDFEGLDKVTAIEANGTYFIHPVPVGNTDLRLGKLILRKVGSEEITYEPIVLSDLLFQPEGQEPIPAVWFQAGDAEPNDVTYNFWVENEDGTVRNRIGGWVLPATA